MIGLLALPLRQDRNGATAMTVALMLPVLLGGIGFGIDTALVQANRSKLQNAADAAATAGARSLRTGDAASAAIAIAEANLPRATSGEVLKTADVVPGYWNSAARTFTANSVNPVNNAVRVTTRFAESNGNEYRTIFARFLGIEGFNLSAEAIAVARQRCVVSTTTALVSASLPTATRVVTQGNPCLPGSNWTGSCYWATPAGNPIIRIDSAYEGPAQVTYRLASPARNFTFAAPYRGSFWVALTDYTMTNTDTTNFVFTTFRSNPAAPYGGGTATYRNKFNVTQTLPGTAICEGGSGGVTASLVS